MGGKSIIAFKCLTSGSFLQVTWLQTDLFTVGLGFLMLSMGLTLTFEDFRRCLRNPWTVRTRSNWKDCLCIRRLLWLNRFKIVIFLIKYAGGCRISRAIFDKTDVRFLYCTGMFYNTCSVYCWSCYLFLRPYGVLWHFLSAIWTWVMIWCSQIEGIDF